MRIAETAERIVYRIAGLPVALGVLIGVDRAERSDPLRSAFAHRYWHPDGVREWSELMGGVLLWPLALLVASVWFTWRSGAAIRSRHDKRVVSQLREQVKLYFSAGVLAPWYYIFSLHDDGDGRVGTFIERFETKTCYFRLLKPLKGTPLNDKDRFARFCGDHGIRCVPTLMHLEGRDPARYLPDQDLFVKPAAGRGGRGAERWDRIGPYFFSGPGGTRLSGDELLERLVEQSRRRPLIVQPRLTPHPELASITAGALPTMRVLTCLNVDGEPEVMASMLRTSFGANRTVDNLHAGGIGALVDVASGRLSRASNLGADARLGWFSTHPDTGAEIEGKIVPCWEEAKTLAVAAHRHFSDRVVIGWDVAVLDDGPIFVEGNGNPDLDILQRFMPVGLREHRFAELLAYHLRERGAIPKRAA
ncbi:MAG TPA: sugar-transfer associated ATP-grasp domain-containing protein [Sphingomicrobium sp.]|nr:sugar-transfer associated ATP-grasp domain-containing protein [Sphingomicrobium sp.]